MDICRQGRQRPGIAGHERSAGPSAGTSGFGNYIFAFSTAALLGTLCSLGLDLVAIRSIAEGRVLGDHARVRATVYRILLLLAVATVLIGNVATVGASSSSSIARRITVSLTLFGLLGIWTALNGVRLVMTGCCAASKQWGPAPCRRVPWPTRSAPLIAAFYALHVPSTCRLMGILVGCGDHQRCRVAV